MFYNPKGSKSYYSKEVLSGYTEAYIDIDKSPIIIGDKKL